MQVTSPSSRPQFPHMSYGNNNPFSGRGNNNPFSGRIILGDGFSTPLRWPLEPGVLINSHLISHPLFSLFAQLRPPWPPVLLTYARGLCNRCSPLPHCSLPPILLYFLAATHTVFVRGFWRNRPNRMDRQIDRFILKNWLMHGGGWKVHRVSWWAGNLVKKHWCLMLQL